MAEWLLPTPDPARYYRATIDMTHDDEGRLIEIHRSYTSDDGGKTWTLDTPQKKGS